MYSFSWNKYWRSTTSLALCQVLEIHDEQGIYDPYPCLGGKNESNKYKIWNCVRPVWKMWAIQCYESLFERRIKEHPDKRAVTSTANCPPKSILNFYHQKRHRAGQQHSVPQLVSPLGVAMWYVLQWVQVNIATFGPDPLNILSLL